MALLFSEKTKCEGSALRKENKEKILLHDLLSFNDKHKFKEILKINKHIDVKSTWKLLNLINLMMLEPMVLMQKALQ